MFRHWNFVQVLDDLLIFILVIYVFMDSFFQIKYDMW
jgi:hypothetical protein